MKTRRENKFFLSAADVGAALKSYIETTFDLSDDIGILTYVEQDGNDYIAEFEQELDA